MTRSHPMAPFGREVAAALAAGRSPNVRLYACSDAWRLARMHRHVHGEGTVLVLPPDADPEAVRWPPIRHIVANVTGLPGPRLHALARALVRDGMERGYLLDGYHPERNLRVVRKRGAA